MPGDAAKLGPRGRLATGVLQGVAALLSLGWGGHSIWFASASTGWPTVSGRVLDIALDSSYSVRRGKTEGVTIRYEYEVRGQTYANDLVAYGAAHGRHLSQAWLDHYEDGNPITVYYDPSNPARSVLERVTPFWAWVILGLGVCLVGSCAWSVRAARRALRAAAGGASADSDDEGHTRPRARRRRPRDGDDPAAAG